MNRSRPRIYQTHKNLKRIFGNHRLFKRRMNWSNRCWSNSLLFDSQIPPFNLLYDFITICRNTPAVIGPGKTLEK